MQPLKDLDFFGTHSSRAPFTPPGVKQRGRMSAKQSFFPVTLRSAQHGRLSRLQVVLVFNGSAYQDIAWRMRRMQRMRHVKSCGSGKHLKAFLIRWVSVEANSSKNRRVVGLISCQKTHFVTSED